jgi:acyl-CoA thioester hydrolase
MTECTVRRESREGSLCILTGPVLYRVIYGDTDAMGFMYYGTYLRVFEMVRSEVMRKLGVPYSMIEKEGFGLPVTTAHIEYAHPALYDDELLIDTSLSLYHRSQVRFEYEIRRKSDGQALTTGYTIHAAIDLRKKRPVRLPALLQRLFSQPEPAGQ